jgi:hypothetical protein
VHPLRQSRFRLVERPRSPYVVPTRPAGLRDEESLYSAAQKFAQVATEILTETIDAKRVFKIMRDWYNNRASWDDPKVMDKFVHGAKVIEAQKRIAVPSRQLAS